jgi:hypothetical protein
MPSKLELSEGVAGGILERRTSAMGVGVSRERTEITLTHLLIDKCVVKYLSLIFLEEERRNAVRGKQLSILHAVSQTMNNE